MEDDAGSIENPPHAVARQDLEPGKRLEHNRFPEIITFPDPSLPDPLAVCGDRLPHDPRDALSGESVEGRFYPLVLQYVFDGWQLSEQLLNIHIAPRSHALETCHLLPYMVDTVNYFHNILHL